MARLNQAQKHAITVVAHASVVAGISREVKGMEGFERFHNEKLSEQERAMVNFFRQELKRIPRDLARMMEAENGASS